jgi:hypothetical protein
LIILGATLYLNKGKKSRLSLKTIFGITFIRLILNPILGGILLQLLWKAEFMLDPV